MNWMYSLSSACPTGARQNNINDHLTCWVSLGLIENTYVQYRVVIEMHSHVNDIDIQYQEGRHQLKQVQSRLNTTIHFISSNYGPLS